MKLQRIEKCWTNVCCWSKTKVVQVVGLTTELANAVPVKPGDYYEQPAHWMKAYDKVMSTQKHK